MIFCGFYGPLKLVDLQTCSEYRVNSLLPAYFWNGDNMLWDWERVQWNEMGSNQMGSVFGPYSSTKPDRDSLMNPYSIPYACVWGSEIAMITSKWLSNPIEGMENNQETHRDDDRIDASNDNSNDQNECTFRMFCEWFIKNSAT